MSTDFLSVMLWIMALRQSIQEPALLRKDIGEGEDPGDGDLGEIIAIYLPFYPPSVHT